MKLPVDRRIAILALAARKGHFVSFDYTKEVKGQFETKRRTLKVGVDVGKRMEKQGAPVKGVGNWHKGATMGRKKMFIRKDGIVYVRGIDVTENPEENKLKIFKIEGISNIK